MNFGDGVGCHEAHIVPVKRILRAWIPKACPDLHRATFSKIVQRTRAGWKRRRGAVFDASWITAFSS
jgi:hypothetical protein